MALVRYPTSVTGTVVPQKYLVLNSSYHVPPLKKRALNCDPHSFAQRNAATVTTNCTEHIWGQNHIHASNDNVDNLDAVVLDEKSSVASSMIAVTTPIEESSEMQISSDLLSYADSLYNRCEDIDSEDDAKAKKHFGNYVTNLLTDWILENQKNPYPNQFEKDRLAESSGLSVQQISDWLANVRKRHLFPVISGKRGAKSPLERIFLKTTTEPHEIKKILSTTVRPFSETFEQAPKIKECLQIRDGTHIPKTTKTSKKRTISNNELDNFWQPQQEIKRISTGAMRLN